MGLAARLKQIELKLRPVTIVPERLFDIDQCIVHLGLDPVAVRESARNISRSMGMNIERRLQRECRFVEHD